MALKVGDRVPHFIAKDDKGQEFDSSAVFEKKPLVIYFYPKDDTPGCTAQACSFRDQYEEFVDLGAEVIGVSGDSASSHEKFAKRYKLPFILLSDENQKIRKLFGVPRGLLGLLPGRVTYVVDQKGIIRYVFDSMIAKNHMPNALKVIKKLIAN
jgi:thioredoxin-dependent peroxiredoxin